MLKKNYKKVFLLAIVIKINIFKTFANFLINFFRFKIIF